MGCRNGTLSHRVVAEADNGQPSITDKQDDQYVRDVRTAFAGVPKLRPQWVDKYMTILVVGESGLGELPLGLTGWRQVSGGLRACRSPRLLPGFRGSMQIWRG